MKSWQWPETFPNDALVVTSDVPESRIGGCQSCSRMALLVVASDAFELRPGGSQGRARMALWRWQVVFPNGAPAVVRDAPE